MLAATQAATGGRRAAGALVVLALSAGLLGLAATAAAAVATGKPDGHDRALAKQLDVKVATFKAIAGSSSSSTPTDVLKNCPLLKKSPSDAFAAVFALLPALLIVAVNEYKPELVDLRTTLAAMHPDSALFAQWLSAKGKSLGLILEFDNHGKKVDLCAAATVMLKKGSTAADIQRVLGINPALIATLFTNSPNSASATLTRINPMMKTFFIAAGLKAKDATTLTSSD